MAKGKILFIHENCGRQGGAEENILATAEQLRNSYTLDLLCTRHSGKGEELFNEVFDTVFCIDWNEEENALRQKVRWVVSSCRPSLIYVHKCLSAPLIEEIVEMAIPTVRMVHDHEVYCMRTYKYFPWSRQVCHRKAGLCCLAPCGAFLKRDRSKGIGFSWVSYQQKQRLIRVDQRLNAYFVASQYMYDELSLQGYEMGRVSVLPPVPTESERSAANPRYGSHRIVFAGQVVRGKGLDCLIRALACVKSPFELIVVGRGSALPYCQHLATTLGIADRIHFLGFVPHEEMALHYRSARIGVVPSTWPEPFGMVGVEMMREGLPIVAYWSGGIGDWLEDGKTGFLVKPLDIVGMAEKIELLLGDETLARRLGQQGAARAIEKFGFEAYSANILSKIQGMIGLPVPARTYTWIGVPLQGIPRPMPLPMQAVIANVDTILAKQGGVMRLTKGHALYGKEIVISGTLSALTGSTQNRL